LNTNLKTKKKAEEKFKNEKIKRKKKDEL